MDRDNKYYNLIESLVKKHRKFPGYEAILDEIIDDVYAHSEVIIKSISNESVIESYLEKVISTSIIVVPKRLKFNSEVSHRVISNEPVSVPEPAPAPESVRVLEPVQIPELAQAPVLEPIQAAEPIELSDEDSESNVELKHDTLLEELIEEDKNEPSNDIMSFTENITSEKADPKFVDQMINTMNSDLVDDINQPDDTLEEALLDESNDLDLAFEDVNTQEQDAVIENPEAENVEYSEVSSIKNLDSLDVEDTEVISEETESIQEADNLMLADDNATEILEEDTLEEIGSETDDTLISEEDDNDIIPEPEDLSEGMLLENDNNIDEDVELLETVQEETSNTEAELDIIEPTLEAQDDVERLSIEDEVESIDLAPEPSLTEIPQEENLLAEEDEIVDLVSDDDGIENASEIEQELQLSDVEELPIVEMSDNTVEDSNSEFEIDELKEDDSAIELVGSDSDDFALEESSDSEESFGVSMDEQDDLFQLQEEITVEEVKKDAPISHKSLDYNVFDFNPSEIQSDVNAEQLSEKLVQLNDSKPEAKILKIFDLRYKKNYTLEQISAELNMQNDEIVAVLNEIVELV